MTAQNNVSQINIYKNRGEWCYAAFTAEGFDHSDPIDVLDNAMESDARAEVAKQFPTAKINRVADTNE